LVLRLRLAAALREVGRTDDAVALYRSVALTYRDSGRLQQAIAVCKSALEIEPGNREMHGLLADLDGAVRRAAPADDAPGPAARSVRVVEPPPSGALPKPPSPEDFRRRSGLTPATAELDLDVPSLATPGASAQSVPPAGPAPARRRRRSSLLRAHAPIDATQPMSPPAAPRTSSARLRITPTPLPPPAVDDDDESVVTAPHPRVPRVSDPLGRTASAELPSVAAGAGATVLDDEVDDDAVTTIAPDGRWGAPPAPPAAEPRAPSVFDEATRLGDSLAAAGEAAVRPAGHTPPPVRVRRITRNTLRRRSNGAGDATAERATDPHRGPRAAPRPASAGPDDATRVEDPPWLAGGDVDEDAEQTGERPAAAWDEPPFDDDSGFAVAVDALAPDGTAIDTPLTLFSDLPEPALSELVRRMRLVAVTAGDVIVREGEPGTACFVIAAGGVRVLKRDPSGEAGLIEVARLGAGAVFGEFALLADRRRHATVQATEDSELYEISQQLLRELARAHPDVGPALGRFFRERLVATLLATAPFFQPLSYPQRAALLSQFRPRRCATGERIIREGQRAGGFYLVVLGEVEVTKRGPGDEPVSLARLGEGSYFGEMSLLRGGTARATVTAAGPTELAVLEPDVFYRVVASYPVLWQQLRKEAHRRELLMQQIVAGDTGAV
ncbi:MAG: hypothetical protein D6689_18500, partial [Deltaproteobacteria bacterium]